MSFLRKCLHCYNRKFASIGRSSKAILNLGGAPTAIAINGTKAYYSDFINSTNKQKSEFPQVKPVSECFIKPYKYEVPDNSTKPYHLGPMDLAMLFGHHIQMGFLFRKPSHIDDGKFSMHKFLTSLKESLSHTLVHFYPLAGRFVLEVDKHKHETRVYVDCNKGPGARFIHAILDMPISNILSQNEQNSLVVQSLFDLGEVVVNYDDYKKPLLCVQVTELIDGVFIACSVNHCMVDGASYWPFWSIWSEIHNGTAIYCDDSRLPVYNHRPDSPIPLPFIDQNELVRKWETPQLIKERIFQFSAESIAKLKAKANEQGNANNNISSFQALCALVWRSMIQANNLPNDHDVFIHLAANIRGRFNPPLPKYSFGNFVLPCTTTTTAGELLENNLGWAASLLHQSVANLNDSSVRETLKKLEMSPCCYNLEDFLRRDSILIANSPKFNMYGHEFGLGKALISRSGYGNKATGFVLACPGINGGGSVDLVIQLPVCSMNALESNEEFTSFALPERLFAKE